MHKTRLPAAVGWTSPTGKTWMSPSQHQPPHAPSALPLTLGQACRRSGLLAKLPTWAANQLDLAIPVQPDPHAPLDPVAARARALARTAIALLDPELSLSPAQAAQELLRESDQHPPDDTDDPDDHARPFASTPRRRPDPPTRHHDSDSRDDVPDPDRDGPPPDPYDPHDADHMLDRLSDPWGIVLDDPTGWLDQPFAAREAPGHAT